MGGFRTPDGIRKPSPTTSVMSLKSAPESSHSSALYGCFVPLRPDPTGPETLDQARQVQLLTKSSRPGGGRGAPILDA
jgi:hypothetical protein